MKRRKNDFDEWVDDEPQDSWTTSTLENYIDKVDRLTVISKVIREYILFCYERRYIDPVDLLLLASFLESRSPNVHYTLTANDKPNKSKGVVNIDLTAIIEKLRKYRDQFDWSELEGYLE